MTEKVRLIDPNQLTREYHLQLILDANPNMTPEAAAFLADEVMALQRGHSPEMARYEANILAWERLMGEIGLS